MTSPPQGPFMYGPDGMPMEPSTVQRSTSAPLSPSGVPIVPPGLILPRPTDSGFGSSSMMAGMYPQLGSDPAMQAIIQQQIYQSYYSRTHHAMTGGGIETSFRELREGLADIAETIQGAAREISAAMRGDGGGGATRPHPVDAPESGAPAAPAARRPHQRRAAPGGPTPLAATPARMAFHSFSVEEVMRRAAGIGARALGDNPGGWSKNEAGEWVRTEYGRTTTAGPMQARMLERSSHLSGALGQISQGEAVGAALPGVARYAGPVAFGAAAVYGGIRAVEKQRYANLAYQQITGGPNFSLTDPDSGFRQRVGESVFRYSQLGVMNGGDARMLYLGATATGLQGDKRQGALDFATSEFRKTGMDVADALNLIQMSVRSGVEEFGTLAKAIDTVSDTARGAGMNVQQAQRSFANTLGAVQTQVTPTNMATTVAAGIQSQITKQGHLLGDNLDFTGMLNQQNMMMQASALGQSPMAYMAGVQEDPALLGRGMQAQMDRIRDAVFGAEALQYAHQQAKAATRNTGGQLTGGDAAAIGRDMAQRGMFNPMQFMQVAQAMGMAGVTPANVYEVAAKVASGGFRFDTALAGGANTSLPGAGKEAAGRAIERAGSGQDNRMIGLQDLEIAKAIRGPDATTGNLDDPASQSYLRHLHGTLTAGGEVDDPGTGQRSAILEGLLREEKSLGKQHFIVQTKDGPKSVDFATAFKFYQDQLVRGDVKVAETGKTVSEITGATGDSSGGVSSSGKPAPKGSKEATAPEGSVTIYADEELRRILRIVTSGGAVLDQSRRQGVPAPAFPARPGDYPSATGD